MSPPRCASAVPSHGPAADRDSGLRVWAKHDAGDTGLRGSGHTHLHQVIAGSRIVVLLACQGGAIVRDYLAGLSRLSRGARPAGEKYPAYPDIAYFEGNVAYGTVDVFSVLLMNLLDSEIDTLSAEVLHGLVRTAITRIMQIVQLFGDDHEAFWYYLRQVGCTSLEVVEKRRQQLCVPQTHVAHGAFRVYGRMYPYRSGNWESVMFAEFKSLKLMTRGEHGAPEYQTFADVGPIALHPYRTDPTHVDETLRERKEKNDYDAEQARRLRDASMTVEPPAAAQAALGEMRGLLRRMQTLRAANV